MGGSPLWYAFGDGSTQGYAKLIVEPGILDSEYSAWSTELGHANKNKKSDSNIHTCCGSALMTFNSLVMYIWPETLLWLISVLSAADIPFRWNSTNDWWRWRVCNFIYFLCVSWHCNNFYLFHQWRVVRNHVHRALHPQYLRNHAPKTLETRYPILENKDHVP